MKHTMHIGEVFLFKNFLIFKIIFCFDIYFLEKLWTAPELLRLWFKSFECNGNKQIQQLHTQFLHGTQKGKSER